MMYTLSAAVAGENPVSIGDVSSSLWASAKCFEHFSDSAVHFFINQSLVEFCLSFRPLALIYHIAQHNTNLFAVFRTIIY